MQPQYYYGPNFGYIVAFKQSGELEWRKVTLAEPEAKHYIHKDASLSPLTEFKVKVKAYNRKGEGPFSLTADVYSALDGEFCIGICHEQHLKSGVADQRHHFSYFHCCSSLHIAAISICHCQLLFFQ